MTHANLAGLCYDDVMNTNGTRYCRKCGKPFAASRTDYTVNCPEHRGRPTTATATTRKKDPVAPVGATCTIPGCGKPAVVCVPDTEFFECATHAPRGSF